MAETDGRPERPINILFTCIGRRVSLLRSFQAAGRALGCGCRIIGTDTTPLSPALQLCDRKHIVSPISSPEYIGEILDIVKIDEVDILIPTVDLDLKALADHRGQFQDLGCLVMVSSPSVIDICQDKRKTCHFLTEHGFNTPVTLSFADAIRQEKLAFPLFLKPWDGSASRGNAIAKDRDELLFYGRRIPNCVVQEYIVGDEYTCDVFVDFDMRVRCVVPRRRIQVRAGEVSKGQVVKDEKIMHRTAELVRMLGAGPGVVTIQLIQRQDGSLRFIEINPRFGGGAPLSIRAGADFPGWILQEMLGQIPDIVFDGFIDRLMMLRYDDEVWLQE